MSTNELEKLFFDTFEIELIEDGTCDMDGECINRDCHTCQRINKFNYPQITDHILLELICICSQYGFCQTARGIKDLKSKVLKRLLQLKKNLKNNYEHQGCHNAFVRKVRKLFKEDNNG